MSHSDLLCRTHGCVNKCPPSSYFCVDCRDRLSNMEQKERKCLSCSCDFLSEWRGNRVCTPCRNTAGWEDPSGLENAIIDTGGNKPTKKGTS